jgi:putative chitinase
MITLDQFRRMIPTNKEPEVWYSIAMEFFPKYDINTTNRIAGFMSQCAQESLDFTILEENLNYSWSGLRRVFGKYFPTDDIAKIYERKPVEIANIVYDDARRGANKLGNVFPGDGWLFRGRGIKQITGRSNYAAFGRTVGLTAEGTIDYLITKRGAFESACWFWRVNNVASFADKEDVFGMTRRINGGTNGLEERRRRWHSAKAILLANPPRPSVNASSAVLETVQIGSRGNLVRDIQIALGIAADGVFGSVTDAAVKSWQRINRYTANGVLNETQIRKLIGR